MSSAQPVNSRQTLDSIIHRAIAIYRWAVLVAFGFLAIGFVIAQVRDQRVGTEMGHPDELIQQVLDLQASGFLGLGIAAMIVTPIVMIAAGAWTFLSAGDRRNGLITATVAVILALSIAVSFLIG